MAREDAFRPGTAGDPRRASRRRPTPWEWLWYSFGGGLSPQLSQWVLRDTTGPTWWLRHLARTLLQVAPLIVLILIFIPGPLYLRIDMVVLGVASALIWAVSMMWGTTEHRLIKAGFPPGTAEQVRSERGRRRDDGPV